jgi:hypothetical protein
MDQLLSFDRGRDKACFAPPSEPDRHISGIRLSSRWLASEKIGRRILLIFRVRSIVVSRYRGGQQTLD